MTDWPPIEKREKFALPGQVPPVGYLFAEELEGTVHKFQAPMRAGMMKQLRTWYAAKKLEWPGDAEMESRIEHFVCHFCPEGFCTGGVGRKPVKWYSVKSLRDGTQVLLDRLLRRQDFMVPPEEADRRARICANCVENMHGICTSCLGNDFLDIFSWFIRAGRKTAYDSVLDTCSVCGCLLRAKVHVSNDTLYKLSRHTYPPNCWLNNTPAHIPEAPK